MIYLDNGNHEFASEVGLREICGYPSPCYHFSFPKYDFLDVQEKLSRGYTSVFKILCTRKLIDKKQLRDMLPDALAACRMRPIRKPDNEENPLGPVHALPVKRLGKRNINRPGVRNSR
jgi:hypothetical protein